MKNSQIQFLKPAVETPGFGLLVTPIAVVAAGFLALRRLD